MNKLVEKLSEVLDFKTRKKGIERENNSVEELHPEITNLEVPILEHKSEYAEANFEIAELIDDYWKNEQNTKSSSPFEKVRKNNWKQIYVAYPYFVDREISLPQIDLPVNTPGDIIFEKIHLTSSNWLNIEKLCKADFKYFASCFVNSGIKFNENSIEYFIRKTEFTKTFENKIKITAFNTEFPVIIDVEILKIQNLIQTDVIENIKNLDSSELSLYLIENNPILVSCTCKNGVFITKALLEKLSFRLLNEFCGDIKNSI